MLVVGRWSLVVRISEAVDATRRSKLSLGVSTGTVPVVYLPVYLCFVKYCAGTIQAVYASFSTEATIQVQNI
jgi:hypothetical protein